MDAIYYLLIISTLLLPLLALLASKRFSFQRIKPTGKILGGFFVLHNALFLIGFSLRGNYIDYCIFALEYFVFCFTIFALFKNEHIYARIVRAIGTGIIAIVFILGLPGIFFFMLLADEMIPDQEFRFEVSDNMYQTKRYTMGFATSTYTRYEFETFRRFSYLPFEQRIDKTEFIDTETDLRANEKDLQITIRQKDGNDTLIFTDTKGNTYKKLLN